MDERSSRIFVGLCLLVLVWIGVYWMWEPEREDTPRITFAGALENPETVQVDPEPGPQNPIELRTTPQPDPDPAPVIQPEVITDLDNHSSPIEVIAPVFAQYTVLKDETMGTIARKIYGPGVQWEVIARANPRVDPRKLKVGQVLRIPVDPENVQGKVVRDNPEGEEDNPRPSKVVEYFVQSGDSLSRIAQRFYGSSRYADLIFENNRDTLTSMDDLKIGQLLRLPPLEDTEDPGG